MNCTQFQLILADYVAGELPPDRRADAQRHAVACRACAEELAGLQSAAAVFDSGHLSDSIAAQHTDDLSLRSGSPLRQSPAPHRYATPAWTRYAAVIALAFTGGYVVRGIGTTGAATEPDARDVTSASTAPPAVVERYNSLADARPDAPTFTRSLLALAAPARSK